MTPAPEPNGLRPKVASACRAFLRSAEPGATAHCLECAARLEFQARMATKLRSVPTPPAVLHSDRFLGDIYARIASESDVGECAAALRAPVVPELDAAMSSPALESALAAKVLATPPRPDLGSWAAVHRAILHDAQSARPSHTYQRWMLSIAAVAAVTVGAVMLTETTTQQSVIVFTDLDAAPGIDFTLLRHGVPR